MADSPPSVLLISTDPVGEEMAGVAIRYSELARVLSAHATVTLAHAGATAGLPDQARAAQREPAAQPSPGERRLQSTVGVRLLSYRPHAPGVLRTAIAGADMVIAPPQWPLVTRWLRAARAQVVFDLYDPETFETLEASRKRARLARRVLTDATLDRLHDALRSGDRFVCASEKQRDLWLGAALGLRLIDPAGYDRDPSLRSVIDVVPYGLPSAPPTDAGRGPRELLAGLPRDAELVLWNGGVWSWLDPFTAIRAVAALAPRRPRLRLVFMGSRGSADAPGVRAARELARELGVLDSTVLFNPGWVPYAERAAWLIQADCALSCQREHLETRFAFRTRILDCFWAGLPVVCTAGDELAERVRRETLGAVVPGEDPAALARALEEVLDRPRSFYAEALSCAAGENTWARVAAPLIAWLTDPPARPRPGRARGAVAIPLAQRLRAAAYLAGGRMLLDRRLARGTRSDGRPAA